MNRRIRKYDPIKGPVRSREWRKKHPSYYTEYLKKYGKEWRASRKKKSLCFRCGIKVEFGTSCSRCKKEAKAFCATILSIRKEDRAKALEAILRRNKFCALCGSKKHNGRGWHLDHGHKTKRFRAVLCNNCNLGLGQFRDSIRLLKLAILYLEKYGK